MEQLRIQVEFDFDGELMLHLADKEFGMRPVPNGGPVPAVGDLVECTIDGKIEACPVKTRSFTYKTEYWMVIYCYLGMPHRA